jgi:hypothetical protein
MGDYNVISECIRGICQADGAQSPRPDRRDRGDAADEIIRPALECPGIRQLIDPARSHRGKVQKIAEQ